MLKWLMYWLKWYGLTADDFKRLARSLGATDQEIRSWLYHGKPSDIAWSFSNRKPAERAATMRILRECGPDGMRAMLIDEWCQAQIDLERLVYETEGSWRHRFNVWRWNLK